MPKLNKNMCPNKKSCPMPKVGDGIFFIPVLSLATILNKYFKRLER